VLHLAGHAVFRRAGVATGTAGEAFSPYVDVAQIPMYFAPMLLAPFLRRSLRQDRPRRRRRRPSAPVAFARRNRALTVGATVAPAYHAADPTRSESMRIPASLRLPTRVRLPVDRLEHGMFVAELDRPWLDTPFLLEGLLVRNDAELRTLRRTCRHVVVDIERSSEAVAGRLRDALARAAARRGGMRALAARAFSTLFRRGARDEPTARPRRFRADAEPQPRRAFSREGLGDGDSGLPTPAAISLHLPRGTTLHAYPEPAPLEQALPRARESWTRGAETLRTLLEDLRKDAPGDMRDVGKVADELVESMIETPDAMLWVARLRDQDRSTYHHCLKVAIHLIALGRQIGFPRDDLVRLAQIGMLADVGKIRLPRALLEKPGMLTPPEQVVVRRHVRIGVETLRKSMALDRRVEEGILQHHERLDGSGYPMGLRGMDIGIFGRMAGIADCFAALISDRPYAKAAAPQDALMQMYGWCGTSFHEPLIEQLVQAIGVFPVGSLVELSNGEAAIVMSHNRVRRLEPRVLVLAGADHVPLAAPFERDLITGPVDGAGKSIRIARGLAAGAYGLQPRDYYADASASSGGHVLAAA